VLILEPFDVTAKKVDFDINLVIQSILTRLKRKCSLLNSNSREDDYFFLKTTFQLRTNLPPAYATGF